MSPSVARQAESTEGAGQGQGVSVIMTVLNERRHIDAAVRAILDQDYTGPLELVIALGPSTDGTDEAVGSLAATDNRIHTVSNPAGTTPCGLNLALKEASHSVVVRVDGHSVLPPSYVSTAVEVLGETGADNVGGVMAAEGTAPLEQAVACAMNSWLGVGGAPFHLGGEAGPAETVYLGSFQRSTLDRVSGYDESLHRAQDWELNYRIRRSGGTVWFTPRMRVTYRPRGDLRGLAKQYFRTGQWRRAVTRQHTETLNARYVAPPAALVGFVGGLAAGVAGFTPAFVLPGGYTVLIVAGSLFTGRGRTVRARAWLPVAYATMHASWGLGFLFSPRELR